VLQGPFDRWARLNNVSDQRRPTGHVWGTIINWANAQNGYYTSNPDLLLSSGPPSFDVSTPEKRAANLAKCVEYLLLNINEYDRAGFDPSDGDTQSSDVVFGFANDVVDALRVHVPNAKLGLYAYAGHRAPASFPCPHLYVQVALGFNNLGIGYQALVEQWGDVAGEVALRGYGDIAAQDGWLPCNAGICQSQYFIGPYPGYMAAGANGINMETSANWCKNIVSHWHAVRYWKHADSTHAAVIAEMLPAIFENDPAVAELFNLWGDPASSLSDYLLAQSCAIVDSMAAAPHKLEFQRYMAFALRDRELLRFPDKGGPYMTALEQNLSWAHAIRNAGTIHTYAYSRQLANTNVTANGRGDLAFNANPYWQRFPVAATEQDYEALRDALAPRVERFPELQDETLVLVDVAPTGQAAALLTTASDYVTFGRVTFTYLGPGTVTVDYDEAFRETEVFSFGGGLHTFTIFFSAKTTWSGGTLFLNAFPNARMDPSTGGQRWAYIPKMAQGRVRLSSDSRLTLTDSVGRKDIKEARPPFTSGFADPQTLQPGVARVDNTNTRGTHAFGNINPYISPTPYKQLMPLALAKAEFPNLVVRA